MSSVDTKKQIITIYDKYVEMNIDGVTKLLSINDFKSVFDNILNVDTIVEPVLLPRNVLMFGKNSNSIKLNTYWPSCDVTINFVSYGTKTTKKYNIKLPNIIIYFDLRISNAGTYSVNTCRYFSTPLSPGELKLGFGNLQFIFEEDKIKEIYPLALPNMYGDGHACYGQNTMPSGFKNDFRGLDWYYLFLKETPFNSDLSIPKVRREYSDPINLLEFLQKEGTYPFDKLFAK